MDTSATAWILQCSIAKAIGALAGLARAMPRVKRLGPCDLQELPRSAIIKGESRRKMSMVQAAIRGPGHASERSRNGAPAIIEGEHRESRATKGMRRIIRQEVVIKRTNSNKTARAEQRPSAKTTIENLVRRTAAPIHGKGSNRTSCASERHVTSRGHGRHDRRRSEFENESSEDMSIEKSRRMPALLTGKTTMTWLPFDVCRDFRIYHLLFERTA